MKSVFRVDASREIGSGHMVRCLALANQLVAEGWSCHFACNEESKDCAPLLGRSGYDVINVADQDRKQSELLKETLPEGVDLLVVDHYGLDAVFETACRPWANKVLVIDDLADRSHDADLLLDQTLGRNVGDYHQLVPGYCRILSGPQFALLRPEFCKARPIALLGRDRYDGDIRRILVSFGGADPFDLTTLVLEEILESGIGAMVDVVLGGDARSVSRMRENLEKLPLSTLFTDIDDMATLMTEADLAIGAGGTTSWERCCMGLPSLVITVSTNQELITRNLSEMGAVEHLGFYDQLEKSNVSRAIQELDSNPERWNAMSYAAREICDGRGTTRLLDNLFQLLY